MRISKSALALVLALGCWSCGGGGGTANPPTPTPTPTPAPTPVPTPTLTAPRPVVGVTQAAPLASFDRPWAVEVLPGGAFLVTQRTEPGRLTHVAADGAKIAVTGLPTNIGLLDIALAPDFAVSQTIYISYMQRNRSAPRIGPGAADPGQFPERMAVARAQLSLGSNVAQLFNVQQIFVQTPYIVAFEGAGEPGGRIAPSPDGRYLFITSGDRQEIDEAFLFSLANNIGKTIRIFPDGGIPGDNPFVATPGALREIWSIGHRNPYGLVFAQDGRLWSSEHGPAGGDEFNLILAGLNYGWPAVSNGNHYNGTNIPDHSPGDGFEAPKVSWSPVIAPAGMIFYRGSLFEDWTGDALLTGLQSHGLVRVHITGNTAAEVQRIALGDRIRDVAEAGDGSLWILTDGSTGELIRLTPVF